MSGAQLVGLDDIGNVEIFGGASFVDFGFGQKKNDVFHFQRPAAHGVNIQFVQQFQEYLFMPAALLQRGINAIRSTI